MNTAINFAITTLINLWNMLAGDFLLSIPIVMMLLYILVDVIIRLKNISR